MLNTNGNSAKPPQKQAERKRHPSGYRRVNRISGQWSPRLIEMLESPAYRALSLSAHRVISRIEIELAHHGGNDNGRLAVTKLDFVAYGVNHDGVAPAIREAAALGFITVRPGRGGNSEHHMPNLFRLTFAHDRNSRSAPPTHEWRKIKSCEQALEIAQSARSAKSAAAVSMGQRGRGKKHFPVLETRTPAPAFPVLETRTPGVGRKPGPLSISRDVRSTRMRTVAGSNPSEDRKAGQEPRTFHGDELVFTPTTRH